MINLNKKFDKKIIEKRKELLKDHKKSEIEVNISDDLYKELKSISEEKQIDINDLLMDMFYIDLLEKEEKPEGIDNVIDTATLLAYTNKILNSNKNYLLINTENLEQKSILITNKKELYLYQNLIKEID
jgi:hypothetical protein